MDDDDGGVKPPSSGASLVFCSICLDSVSDNGNRSRAKLQCGHEFHLDCIGSAFNTKGAMQCPNCRKVEKGRWLFANSSTRSFPEFSMDDWISDEEPYDIGFSEMPFRVHWCPFSGMTRIRSSFEEVESPSTAYHDLQGHHAIFAEHTAASSVNSYVAYLGHIPPTSSNSSDSVDDPINHHWNGLSGHSEIFAPHAFPAIDIQYQNWGHRSHQTSSHITGADQASVPPVTMRSTRESDALTRSGSFAHPFLLVHGSGPRAGSSFVPSVVPHPHHPGSNIRSHERVQVPHVFHHPQQPSNSPGMPSSIIPGIRRHNGPRGLPPVLPATSQSDHSGGFYVFPPLNSSGRNLHEADNPLPNHFHTWERDYLSHFPVSSFDRDSGWGSLHQPTGGSDSGNRPSSYWQRH
ncbi:hypothetical protein L1049_004616 [Liquidambar formosana]|uniref:RING-type domain-containing protein n=1 Tax=Liquidambar formosana TaxID=63359 RepID=A0AAP0RNF8_LIQFO